MSIQKEKKLLIIFGFIAIIIISTALLATAQDYVETEVNAQIGLTSDETITTSNTKNMNFINCLEQDIPITLINATTHFNSEYLTIQIYQENRKGGKLIIYDKENTKIKQVLVAPNHQTLQVNVKALKKGAYKVVFQNEKQHLSQRFKKEKL